MTNKYDELMIAVCGNVDAGKSSLIGVLSSGKLDDGRGSARQKILMHHHEKETGRTSNISLNPILYKNFSNKIYLCNYQDKNKRLEEIQINKSDSEINKSKIILFVDLAGHEKYLKTTVYGLTGTFPNYGIVVMRANHGITRMTREHLGILLYLKVPIIIIITKIDITPSHIYKKLCNRLKNLLSKKTYGKVLYFISDSDKRYQETNTYISKMSNNYDIIPVISASNKNGMNIDNIHKILYSLPLRNVH